MQTCSSLISLQKYILIFFLLFTKNTVAQLTPQKLVPALDSIEYWPTGNTQVTEAVKKTYNLLDYQPIWLGSIYNNRVRELLLLVEASDNIGLNSNDYQPEYLREIIERKIILTDLRDSIKAEIKLSFLALDLLHDAYNGNAAPLFGYDGLMYAPSCYDLPAVLSGHVRDNSILKIPDEYPTTPEIKAMATQIKRLRSILSDSAFREEKLVSSKLDTGNRILLVKLFQMGVIDSIHQSITEDGLKERVKEAQRQLNQIADGVMRTTFIQSLNISLSNRLRQLKLSINYYRWLNCLSKQEPVIVVNIPSAYLKVYYHDEIIEEMRMIVGKASTPTPLLTSRVKEVILYPYWHVPYSIATKELLPAIKKNPGYINAHNYQVLDKSGSIINPYSIDWSQLSTTHFPYIIRQSTGCDNALGLIKFDFFNPYSVYLHDTPSKSLFSLHKRYFSHGCMRLGEPMNLGHLILKSNAIAIDTLEQKGCLRNQSPIRVKPDENIPVIVWYNPAGVDSSGRVIFYEDPYRKFKWLAK